MATWPAHLADVLARARELPTTFNRGFLKPFDDTTGSRPSNPMESRPSLPSPDHDGYRTWSVSDDGAGPMEWNFPDKGDRTEPADDEDPVTVVWNCPECRASAVYRDRGEA